MISTAKLYRQNQKIKFHPKKFTEKAQIVPIKMISMP